MKSLCFWISSLLDFVPNDITGNNPELANDTKILLRAFNSNSNKINIEDCGTAMRFLTAYFSIKNKDIVITGASRMKYRPIKPLIDALNNLGARISILDGKHLLEIKRRKLSGGRVKINADISSQFITALLLIAHSFKNGLKTYLKRCFCGLCSGLPGPKSMKKHFAFSF